MDAEGEEHEEMLFVRLTGKPIYYLFSLTPLVVFFVVVLCTHAVNTAANAPHVLVEYRLYRTLYALVAGGVLSVSGCLLQSSLRNPLVDHYVLGIGSGAVFATYVAVLVLGYYSLLATALAATAGGLLALFLAVAIAERISGSDVAYVLSGVSIATLFSGLSAFTYYYAVTRYRYASLLLVGSFVHSRPVYLWYITPPVFLVVFGYLYLSKKLNTLLLGDDYAMQLGVNPRTTRLLSSLIAGASSSIIVGFFGTIGFLGLVAPHIARFLLRTSDNRVVIPVASTTGMLLLYVTDAASRHITAPLWGEIPAGSLVSLIGAPFFVALLLSRFSRRRM
ncbi:MAG: iron ABC transporter permease [Desulfurococcaceae archaeon]